ncbi:hypothetical protein [Falsiroseomonas sp. HW251]|uniref:hypothetical protein n=1 Tax=Falsiroseomonas sp. HW251 TaxID=3390998 RepID=UPI003D310721
MLISRLVVALGLATQQEVDQALAEQRRTGRRLKDILTGMGTAGPDAIERAFRTLPVQPLGIEDLHINRGIARDVFLKAASLGLTSNIASVSAELHVSSRVATQLIEEARQLKHIEFKPSSAGDIQFSLSGEGRAQAEAAFESCAYVGPLPVSVEDYAARIRLQSVYGELVTPEQVQETFGDMIIREEVLRDIGAAANSSRSALLYGPPGNGKTTIAEKIGRLFQSFVFIPHAFEVAGQIVRVFDGSIHHPISDDALLALGDRGPVSIVAEEYDQRWVPCRRPFVFAGGELTPEMLELNFNDIAKYYEAPLQVKANNGVFLIDDFGRQIIPPRVLLNRWIVPMDRRVDYLKLNTGKSFSLPFDALLLFSTNIGPEELMDPTFLRRIAHKIEVGGPNEAEFRAICHSVSAKTGIKLSEESIDYALERIKASGAQVAAFQPGFILDQIRDLRRFLGSRQLDERSLVDFALRNLLAGTGERGFGLPTTAATPMTAQGFELR